MAIESKRGCGYRKIGNLYLVSQPLSVPCDRMPIKTEICPCCGQGIKFSRGFTWISPIDLFGGDHGTSSVLGKMLRDAFGRGCSCPEACPACYPSRHFAPNDKCLDKGSRKAGLMWVGKKHYTVESFIKEGAELGISKRINSIPRNFVVGETWVFLAHKEAFEADGKKVAGIICAYRPRRVEMLITASQSGDHQFMEGLRKRNITPVVVPHEHIKDHS